MGREELLLSAAIAETIGNASKAETTLGNLIERAGGDEEAHRSDEMQEPEETLRFYLEKLYRDVGILAERLRLPLLKREIGAEFRSYKPNALINMEHVPWDVGLHSPALANVCALYQSLATMTDRKATTGIDVFGSAAKSQPSIQACR